MSDHSPIFIGLDLGTSGVRAIAVDAAGKVKARAEAPLPRQRTAAASTHEQNPQTWWWAVVMATRSLTAQLRQRGCPAPTGLSVDGTSGTIVPVDSSGSPVRPALMYNDSRATAEADWLNAEAAGFCQRLGYRFAASFSLAKIEWLRRHEPDNFRRTNRFLHQADFIVHRLTGEASASDYSNALKSGYDLIDECWPSWLQAMPGTAERLPEVWAPGTIIGHVREPAAYMMQLPCDLPVIAGATDGTAACLASGLRQPGDYSTTVGTTLVFKGLSRNLCRDPDGLIYCHKYPGGHWLPGAASNTGCEWIQQQFADADLLALQQEVEPLLPTDHLAYPLARRGERFPFRATDCEGYGMHFEGSAAARYAAGLQGTAFIERWCYEVLDAAAGCNGTGAIYSTGGGARSAQWMQLRADVTGRTNHLPACGESAFGAAILAAAGVQEIPVTEAVKRMVSCLASFAPDPARKARYDVLYERFRMEMAALLSMASEANG